MAAVYALVMLTIPCGLFSGLPDALESIRAVGQEGHGSPQAATAWKEVAKANAKELPVILAAMDGANPLAQNWLRAAVDTIASRKLNAQTLPTAQLPEFIRDRNHCDQARELAYRWLNKLDPKLAKEMVPSMLDDPCVALRSLAVAQKIEQAKALEESGKKDEAAAVYSAALASARDVSQIRQIAAALKKAGQQVDLPRHFGFLMQWKVIAPFDNTGRKGFETIYPPEEAAQSIVDLTKTYPGKDAQAEWKDFVSQHEYGLVDLNKPFGDLKEVVGYAYTQFHSDEQKDVELRLGCKNAWKVWLNGQLLFGRDEYHRGMQIDQYVMKATLRPGTNHILVKVCQNEEKYDWTKEWEFQLRVCDASGTAIHSPAPPSFAQAANTKGN